MKLKSIIPLLILFLFSCQQEKESLQTPGSQPEKPSDFVPGVLYIKLNSQAESHIQLCNTASATFTGIPDLDSLALRLGATKIRRLFPPAGKFEKRTRAAGLHLWYLVQFDKNKPVTKASNDLSKLPEIEYSEPVPDIAPEIKGKAVPVNNPVSFRSRTTYPFDDPRLPEQWHYHNEGTMPDSRAGADINLLPAWNISTGSPKVIVAIVDGGIDIRHEDLRDNLWINEAEKNGKSGIDDDDNGYIDDLHGFNFVDQTGTIVAQDHGTHVAGTVSAVNNNGKGVCGVAGGSGKQDGVRLMSCEIYKPDPNNPNNDIGTTFVPEAIKYGADNGAVISQNSWGYQFKTGQTPTLPKATQDAIDYFIEHAGTDENGQQTGPMKGGIVIFAAGNENTRALQYPAGYSKVICVASMSPDFTKAYYSNYGNWITLTAPGGTAPYSGHYTEAHQVLSTLPGNQYGYMQGTSMACPHVSGIAALVVSKYGGEGFTPELLRMRLVDAAKDYLYEYNPDYRNQLGRGCIDANLALGQNEGIPPEPVTDLRLEWQPTRLILDWTITRDEDNVVPMRYDLLYSTQELVENPDYQNLPAHVSLKGINIGKAQPGDLFSFTLGGLQENTTYYLQLTAVDPYGNRSSAAPGTGKTLLNNLPVITCRESGEIILSRYGTHAVIYDVEDAENSQCSVTLDDPNRAAQALIEGKVITVTIKAAEGKTGRHEARLVVTDEDGGNVSQTLIYTIQDNQAPEVIQTPGPIQFAKAGETQNLNLTEYFNDPDQDELIYTTVFGTSGIASALMKGNTLQLTALKSGRTDVVVTARDPYGKTAMITFTVAVGNNSSGSSDSPVAGLKLYPNPVTDNLHILLDTEKEGLANILICSRNGAQVLSSTIKVKKDSPAKLDLSKLSGGSYILKLTFDGKEQTRNIIKL